MYLIQIYCKDGMDWLKTCPTGLVSKNHLRHSYSVLKKEKCSKKGEFLEFFIDIIVLQF